MYLYIWNIYVCMYVVCHFHNNNNNSTFSLLDVFICLCINTKSW